jgi:arsenate reductase (glutaredoxin)
MFNLQNRQAKIKPSMKTETIRIYYNPRCSKCRDAVALVQEQGYKTELIKYLETPPTKEALKDIVKKLGIKPLQLVRQGEAIFKQEYAAKTLSDEAWLDAMVAHPVLIERPVVIRGNRAVIARPPEKALDIL